MTPTLAAYAGDRESDNAPGDAERQDDLFLLAKERIAGITDVTARRFITFIEAAAQGKFILVPERTAAEILEKRCLIYEDVRAVLEWPAEDLSGYARAVDTELDRYLAADSERTPEAYFELARQRKVANDEGAKVA
jgi:hypothetical protein